MHIYEKVDGSIFLWSVDLGSIQEAVGCCSGREMGKLYYVLNEDILCQLKCTRCMEMLYCLLAGHWLGLHGWTIYNLLDYAVYCIVF